MKVNYLSRRLYQSVVRICLSTWLTLHIVSVIIINYCEIPTRNRMECETAKEEWLEEDYYNKPVAAPHFAPTNEWGTDTVILQQHLKIGLWKRDDHDSVHLADQCAVSSGQRVTTNR